MIAVFYNGDIKIHNITGFELSIAWNTVTNLLINGSANAFWKSFIIKWCWNGFLDISYIVMAELIECLSSYPCFDMRVDHVEHFRGQTAGYSHFFDFFGRFYDYVHVFAYTNCCL